MPSTPSEIEALVMRLNAHSGTVPRGELRDDLRRAADALARTAQAPAIGREDLKAVIGTKRRDWISSHGTKGIGIDDAIADAILAAFPHIATPDEARARMFREGEDG